MRYVTSHMTHRHTCLSTDFGVSFEVTFCKNKVT